MILPTQINISITTTAQNVQNFLVNYSSRTQITCFRCGEQGHYKSECFNWKTRLCWHHMNTTCMDPNCAFAHGAEEERSPWLPRCVRIVKRDGQLTVIGCKQYGHTFKSCPN